MESHTRSRSFFARGETNTTYCIDGIDLSFLEKASPGCDLEKQIEEAEKTFLDRVSNLLRTQSLQKIA